MKKRLFQWFTFWLLLVTAIMAYGNVISDDTAVRKLSKDTLTDYAGCKDKCQISGMRGERGMINETIEYDIERLGHYVVACHRKYVAIGDHLCVVTEGKPGAPASSSATPLPSR